MKKKNIILSTIAVSAVLISGAIFVSKENLFPISAEGCKHEHVEHYDGVLSGTNGVLEHWACCECHHAWADEALTTELTDDTFNHRDPLSVNVGVAYQVNWDALKSTPIYHANRGYSFKNYIVDYAKDASNAIETINSPFQLTAGESQGCFGLITNKTSQVIRVDVHTRAWGSRPDQFYLGVNETKEFHVTVDQWNAEQSGGNYGFALLCYNTEEQEAGGYIEVTRPEYELETSPYFSHMEDGDWHALLGSYNDTYGVALKADVASGNHNIHFQNRVKIDETKYDGLYVDVFNACGKDSNSGNIWSEAWGDHVCTYNSLKNGQWNTIFITNYVWNAENSMITFYDLGLDSGYLYFANFRYAEKPIFGALDDEQITIESAGWSAASKEIIYDKGKAFVINYPGNGSIATNNGKSLNEMEYSKVYFYVYNGTSSPITMNSTPDWSHYTYYDTIEPNKWTRCEMSVSDWNIAATTYFYPSAPAGKIIVSYFYAEKIEKLAGFSRQLIDLNINTQGEIDETGSVSLDLINDSRIKSVDVVKYNGVTISNSESIPLSSFGKTFGETTLNVRVSTDDGFAYIEYPILLCSKVISTKEDLDAFPAVAGGLGDVSNFIYDGYFALANDIEYNGNWNSFIHNSIFRGEITLDENNGFIGTFDGCGHLINGLHVFPTNDGTGDDWNGNSFIYKLGKNGVIKNVGFTNARLTAAGGYITSFGEGTIKDVYVKYSNAADYSDGLNTFFYYDRSNDKNLFFDNTYASSLPIRVENCFVDASTLPLSGKENTHVIGSKMYGDISLRNVFAICDSSYKANAVHSTTGGIGSFVGTSSEIQSNEAAISDINTYLTASIFSHSGVSIPKTYTGSKNVENFIKDGQSSYVIYASENLTSSELEALNLLVSKIKQFTGVELYTSLNNNSSSSNCSISFKNNGELTGNYAINIDSSKNIELSYSSIDVAYKMVLKALEVIFGYKNMSLEFEYIPNIPSTVNLTSQNVAYNCATSTFSIYTYADNESQKLNGLTNINETFINVVSNYDSSKSGQYHNMFFYLPPEIYYEDHPSWYTPGMDSSTGYFGTSSSLHYSNLCFSANGNASELEAMKDTFYERLKANLLANPNLNDICVGQNDNDQSRDSDYCSCATCKALNNQNIAFISFLNDMSRRIKADSDFAGRDIYLYLMAYRSSLKAPSESDITCDSNVGVWYAPIDYNHAYALNDSTNNPDTANDIANWAKITNNISLYLYDTNFVRPFSPFLSFESMVENVKYMKSLNAKHIIYCTILENTSKTGFGAFADYILHRLSVDIDLTYDELKAEFFGENGYYGAGGPRMEYYFDQLMAAISSSKGEFGKVYNANTVNILSGSIGSQSFWKQYSIDENLSLLDSSDPYYETYKKNIETEGILLRYLKYVCTDSWYSGDSMTQFINDCKSHGLNLISEHTLISEIGLQAQRI